MRSLPELVASVLEHHGDQWTPKDRAVLTAVAQSSLDLLSLAARGHDISKDLPQLEAQALAITAAEAHVTRGILRDLLNLAVGSLVQAMLPLGDGD